MSLFEILLGKAEEMSVNPPPAVMETSTFTVMSRLHSQYINLCNTNDEEGTIVLNSTPSMIHLTCRNYSLIELGIFCFTWEVLGQMHNNPSFMYM